MRPNQGAVRTDQGERIVYDNQIGAPADADATTAITGGEITIRRPRGR